MGDAATALAAADIVLKVQRPLIGGGADGVGEPGGTDELGLMMRGISSIAKAVIPAVA